VETVSVFWVGQVHWISTLDIKLLEHDKRSAVLNYIEFIRYSGMSLENTRSNLSAFSSPRGKAYWGNLG
jgi:hypothetical protein